MIVGSALLYPYAHMMVIDSHFYLVIFQALVTLEVNFG